MGRNWHFLNNILSGPPTGSLPNGQIPLWDLIVGIKPRHPEMRLCAELHSVCLGRESDCLVCSHCEAALFLSSSWRLFVKHGGKMWEATFLPFIYFFPVLGTGIRFFFVLLLYSWELCFFHCICGCCNIDFSWPSLCRLCFINDQLCGLGRGIVFIWHRLALVQSSSCKEAETQPILWLWKCESSSPVARVLHL